MSTLFRFVGLLGQPIIIFAKNHDRFMKEVGLYMKDWEKRVSNGVWLFSLLKRWIINDNQNPQKNFLTASFLI